MLRNWFLFAYEKTPSLTWISKNTEIKKRIRKNFALILYHSIHISQPCILSSMLFKHLYFPERNRSFPGSRHRILELHSVLKPPVKCFCLIQVFLQARRGSKGWFKILFFFERENNLVSWRRRWRTWLKWTRRLSCLGKWGGKKCSSPLTDGTWTRDFRLVYTRQDLCIDYTPFPFYAWSIPYRKKREPLNRFARTSHEENLVMLLTASLCVWFTFPERQKKRENEMKDNWLATLRSWITISLNLCLIHTKKHPLFSPSLSRKTGEGERERKVSWC